MNNVKGSAINTRLFRELCKDMDAAHTTHLFHTHVSWFSKGSMPSRLFELWQEIKFFFFAQEKVDLLSAFNKEGYEAHMA